MRLPKIEHSETSGRQNITGFNGINLREAAADGELTRSENLSSRRYPYLAPRLGRTVEGSYSNPTSLFSWDKLLVVADGVLYYDGEAIDNVTQGEKQFAVVNTKLCVFPDKKYIDLTNNEFKSLEANAQSSSDSTFTSNTFSAALEPKVRDTTEYPGWTTDSYTQYVYINTYGSDPSALSWDAENGWTRSAAVVFNIVSDRAAAAGQVFIPQGDGTYFYFADCVFATGKPGSVPTTQENDQGYYGIIRSAYAVGEESLYGGTYRCTADIYKKNAENPLFSASFIVGDRVNISGSIIPANNVEMAAITAIDDDANTLTFPDSTFIIPSYYYTAASELASGSYQFRAGSAYYRFVSAGISTGTVLYLLGSTLYGDDGSDAGPREIASTASSSSTSGYTTLTATAYDGGETAAITVSRPVPDLDFVCECNNRLWGVSNSVENKLWNADKQEFETYNSRVIYASALGSPGSFHVYDGLATDSYALAVASRGDFTGCVAYSGQVLCWKEDLLHRIVGDYPANYAMYTDSFEGVQSGSHKACAIINEVLYYKARSGVYAYAGAQPSLVSYKLGLESYSEAAAGTDGLNYCVSMKDSGGDFHLFVYDTVHGVWYREGNAGAADFTYAGGSLYMAVPGNVYRLSGADCGGVEWSAALAEFDEGACERKQYRWLRLLADIAQGAELRVEISVDGGRNETVCRTAKAGLREINIPLRGMRCGRMAVTLSGVGEVVIRRVTRDYIICSEEG